METTFKTLAEFKAINKAQGNHFFDRKTMQFFNSRIESGLLHDAYFITSESDMHNTERFYNVRSIGMLENGEYTINTIGGFNTIKTKEGAKKLIKHLATTLPS
jgi:hypothetical protein